MKFLAVAILVLWSVVASAEDASTVRISQSDGSVEIQKSGTKDWRPAKEGDTLERGDRLAARDKSAALLLAHHWLVNFFIRKPHALLN